MNNKTLKDVDRAFKALDTLENTELHCIFCVHCQSICKSSNKLIVQCEHYSAPMREFECFEQDPLIIILE